MLKQTDKSNRNRFLTQFGILDYFKAGMSNQQEAYRQGIAWCADMDALLWDKHPNNRYMRHWGDQQFSEFRELCKVLDNAVIASGSEDYSREVIDNYCRVTDLAFDGAL